MRPRVHRFGAGKHPVVVCDNFTCAIPQIMDMAASLAPFPADEASYYPGVRRAIGPNDGAATDYVDDLMKSIAPLIASTFNAPRMALLSASFSVVTRPPDHLLPMQRVPHYDSVDPDYIALIHYIHSPVSSATAFFRQRTTGIECVEETNVDRFVDTAKREIADDETREYVQGSDRSFEQVGRVEAKPDRLAFYQGSLLHSAIIPPDMLLGPDPRRGRLTANFFLRLHRISSTSVQLRSTD